MSILDSLKLVSKAAGQLGIPALALYASYQAGLRSGYYRWATPAKTTSEPEEPESWMINTGLFPLPTQESLQSVCDASLPGILSLAEEISAGQVRLFGGPPISLDLVPPKPLAHWTAYEIGQAPPAANDIKWVWEPARFGWAISLAQAFLVTSNDRYAQAFWRYLELFLESNPPCLGPNWISAQEIALRLIALIFSIQIFIKSPQTTPDRLRRLSQAIAAHATRIPPTLIYARAQNNNHLLCEAAGLITAGIALHEHPQAAHWRLLGRRWFFHAIHSQIAPSGAYTQQSTNYHRLLLQIALWVYTLREPFPESAMQKLASATQWLLHLVDPESGAVPNLGPNDGAYILPLSACPFSDYRPTLQSASLSFLGRPAFPAGPWDDMAIWFNGSHSTQVSQSPSSIGPLISFNQLPPIALAPSPHILYSPDHRSWAYLRVVHFYSRPGHADQLHLDLWWRGVNLALDPGSFSYNDPPPWDNALASTSVHNTISIDGKNQMNRAGRFLWLDWAQAEIISTHHTTNTSFSQINARHDGYRQIGVIHQRAVTAEQAGQWRIVDTLQPVNPAVARKHDLQSRLFFIRLHWLLPDWPWLVDTDLDNTSVSIQLESPHGLVQLHLEVDPVNILSKPDLQLVRAGEMLRGNGTIDPTWGWVSPTYQSRFPALSVGYQVKASLPLQFISEWNLPDGHESKE